MSTRAPQPTPPWDATEAIPPAAEPTRPMPAPTTVSASAEPYPEHHRAAPADEADARRPAARTAAADDAARTGATGPAPEGTAETTRLPSPDAPRTAGPGSTTGTGTGGSAVGSAPLPPLPPVGRPTLATTGTGASTTAPGGPGAGTAPGAPGDGGPGPAPSVREWGMFSPKTLFFGTLDLLVDLVLNLALLSLIGALLVAGVTTLPLLGVGVLVLAATVYVAMGAVWLERRRSASSFGLDVRDPGRRTSPRTDWVRVPHQVWLDASDGPLWLGVIHLALTCVLGWLALAAFVVAGAGIVLIFSPLFMPQDSVLHQVENAVPNLPGLTLTAGSVLAVVLSILLALLATLGHRGLSAGLLKQSEAARLRREALESQRRAEHESAAKESAVRGAETERSRIERDLHDGVQPQLVSVAMNLSMARSKIDTDPAAAKELVAEAHGTTKAAITELRRLARGFHPAVLEDRGLDAALSAVAAQAPFPVDVAVNVPRLEPRTEAAVYFAVSESLTNAVKHSGARSADVAVSVQDGPTPGTRVVVAGVRDSGRGGAQVVPGGGLSGIRDRIRSAGGRFFLNSPAGGPTEVVVELPLDGTRQDTPATAPGRHGETQDGSPRQTRGGDPRPGTGGAASSSRTTGEEN